MTKIVHIRNKGFSKHCFKLTRAWSDIPDLKSGHTLRLNRISPFMGKLSENDKSVIIREATSNPWYVLRELVRVKVGNTKRYITLSDGEMLALINANYGGRTFVSAPHGTCNTNLLVLLTLMRLPKVVIYTTYGNRFKDELFEKRFMERYNSYVDLMPDYIKTVFKARKPHLMPYGLIDHHSRIFKSIQVAGFKTEDLLIVSENYELGENSISTSLLKEIDALRTADGITIPWLLTSPQNDESSLGGFLLSLDQAMYENVGQGKDLFVPITLNDMPRFKSDRAKTKYYQSMINQYGLEQIFEPRS